MRSLILMCLVGVSAASQASFELMMVLDRTSQSIKRFDSTSGVYLGSFANGAVDGGSSFNLMIDQPNGEVVVGDGSATTNYAQVYNYNSGQYIGDRYFNYGTTYGSGNSGVITSKYNSDASFVLSNSINGTYNGYVRNTGSNFTMSGSADGTRVYAVDFSTKTLHWWNSLFLGTSTGSVALANPGSFFFSGEMAVSSTRLAFASASGTGAAALWLGDINTGSGTPTMRSINISSRYSAAYHTVFGHNDDVYIGAVKTSGAAVIARYNFVTGAWRGEFGAGQISDVGGLTMVVAPEPAPFIAMGLGLTVLLRRRKRTKA